MPLFIETGAVASSRLSGQAIGGCQFDRLLPLIATNVLRNLRSHSRQYTTARFN